MKLAAVLHRNRDIRTSLRRSVSSRRLTVKSCRSLGRIGELLKSELVEVCVIDVLATDLDELEEFRRSFAGTPFIALSDFRPDHGVILQRCRSIGMNCLLVEKVDLPVAGEVLARNTITAVLKRELGDAPALMRLKEPIQLEVWSKSIMRVGERVTTAELAGALSVTREHLSREFGAGGAPNLKRVLDLVRIAVAAKLLLSPGLTVGNVAGILHYSSASHLAEAARRIAGVRPRELPELGPRGVLAAFLKGRTRSRL